MENCRHCGSPTDEAVRLKSKWVSWGPVGPYDPPLNLPCCKECKGPFMDDRAKHFAVLDETMNTHRDFCRTSGQEGYVQVPGGKRVQCMGWQKADEVGVEYFVSDRYKSYF